MTGSPQNKYSNFSVETRHGHLQLHPTALLNFINILKLNIRSIEKEIWGMGGRVERPGG